MKAVIEKTAQFVMHPKVFDEPGSGNPLAVNYTIAQALDLPQANRQERRFKLKALKKAIRCHS